MGKVRGTRKEKNPSNCYEEKIRQIAARKKFRQIAWCVAKIEMKRYEERKIRQITTRKKFRQIAWCVAKIEMKRGRKKLP